MHEPLAERVKMKESNGVGWAYGIHKLSSYNANESYNLSKPHMDNLKRKSTKCTMFLKIISQVYAVITLGISLI